MPRAAHLTHRPPSLAPQRPGDWPPSTPEDPFSNSIAGRRASGFLQVSLSTRHQHRGLTSPSRAKALPMNASDYPGPSLSAAAHSEARLRQPGGLSVRIPVTQPSSSAVSLGARGSGSHEARRSGCAKRRHLPGTSNVPSRNDRHARRAIDAVALLLVWCARRQGPPGALRLVLGWPPGSNSPHGFIDSI
jgi:hypothetical protein